jgi:basic membrane protein A and related proteins
LGTTTVGQQTIFTIFTGPLKNQHGAEKVSPGKSLTIDELLVMDWLVDGVEAAVP